MDDYSNVINVDEITDAKYINTVLLETQESWARRLYSKLLRDYEQNEVEKGKLSCAFSFGVSEHYIKSDKKIMIVGQEANGHTFDYENWCLKNWQSWAVDYLDYQVYDENQNDRKFKKNNSPFWQFINALKEKGFGVCWNNLDKVRRYVKVDGKEWKEDKLPYDRANGERKILNTKIFDANSKSLLEKEIAIVQPDIVVFAIGPSNPYYHTLYSAFLGSDYAYEQMLKECPYPTTDNVCPNIKDKLNLTIPAYYTYHPNFLKQSKKFENVISKIIGK